MPIPAALLAGAAGAARLAPLVVQGARWAAPHAKHLAGHLLPQLAVTGVLEGGHAVAKHLNKKRKYKRAQDGRFTAAMNNIAPGENDHLRLPQHAKDSIGAIQQYVKRKLRKKSAAMASLPQTSEPPRLKDLTHHLQSAKDDLIGTISRNTKSTIAHSPAAKLIRKLRKKSAAMAQAPGTLKAYTAKRRAGAASKRAARIASATAHKDEAAAAPRPAINPQPLNKHVSTPSSHQRAVTHAIGWHTANQNDANPKVAAFHRKNLERLQSTEMSLPPGDLSGHAGLIRYGKTRRSQNGVKMGATGRAIGHLIGAVGGTIGGAAIGSRIGHPLTGGLIGGVIGSRAGTAIGHHVTKPKKPKMPAPSHPSEGMGFDEDTTRRRKSTLKRTYSVKRHPNNMHADLYDFADAVDAAMAKMGADSYFTGSVLTVYNLRDEHASEMADRTVGRLAMKYRVQVAAKSPRYGEGMGFSGVGDAVVRATVTVSKKMLPYVQKLCSMLGLKIVKIAKENYASDLIKSVIVIEGARRALMLLKEALTLFHRPDKQGMSFAQDVEMGLISDYAHTAGRAAGAVAHAGARVVGGAARVVTAPHRAAIGHIVSGPKRIVKGWKQIGGAMKDTASVVGEGVSGFRKGSGLSQADIQFAKRCAMGVR